MHPFEFDKLKKIRRKQRLEKNKLTVNEKLLNRRKKQAESLREDQIFRNNPNENKFKEYLILNNISFVWQKIFFDVERYVCVDFFLTDYNLVVEIDGKVHEKTRQYDHNRSKYLKDKHGINDIIRFTNKDVALNSKNINDFIKNLKSNHE